MLEALASAVEDLELWPRADVLATAIGLRDRLDAKIAGAFAEFDAAGGWCAEGATSGAAWLRSRCVMARGGAVRFAARARRLAALPVCAAAAADGTLSAGQVEAVLAVVDQDAAPLLAAHEADLVPHLAPLTVSGVARALAAWRARAAAELPEPAPPAEPVRRLHLSATLGGRFELSGSLDAEGGSVVQAALALAATDDGDAEPVRLPATRRADALVDVCRFFLAHRQSRAAGRHRPHLNVVVDLEDLVSGGGGRVVDGPRLEPATMSKLACDAVVHRVVFSGRSAVLDYGLATRTIPTPLRNALVVRDEHCRFGAPSEPRAQRVGETRRPGCDRPASWCECHHVVWFSHGGPTSIDNTVLVCSRHHHLLHQPGWQAKLRPDATLEVTDPEGRVRTTSPPRAGPMLW